PLVGLTGEGPFVGACLSRPSVSPSSRGEQVEVRRVFNSSPLPSVLRLSRPSKPGASYRRSHPRKGLTHCQKLPQRLEDCSFVVDDGSLLWCCPVAFLCSGCVSRRGYVILLVRPLSSVLPAVLGALERVVLLLESSPGVDVPVFE
ncbi:hypothetical protein Ancab_015446, partial [Ancistrocladus abbreviatus]